MAPHMTQQQQQHMQQQISQQQYLQVNILFSHFHLLFNITKYVILRLEIFVLHFLFFKIISLSLIILIENKKDLIYL